MCGCIKASRGGFFAGCSDPHFYSRLPSSPKRKWGGEEGGKRECFISLLSLLSGLGRAPYEVISGGGGGKSCVEKVRAFLGILQCTEVNIRPG